MGKNVSENKILTIQQRNAAQHYIKYGIQHDAYASAFEVKNMKRKTVDRAAVRLFGQMHIKAYMQTLYAEDKSQFDLEIAQIKQILVNVVSKCMADKKDAQGNIVPVDPNAAIRAVNEINRMNGNHAPIKTDFLGQINIKIASDENKL